MSFIGQVLCIFSLSGCYFRQPEVLHTVAAALQVRQDPNLIVCIVCSLHKLLSFVSIVILFKPMTTQIQDPKFPFLNKEAIKDPDKGYFRMIKNRTMPNFAVLSQTTVIVFVIIVGFVLARVGKTPSDNTFFLMFPTSMNYLALDVGAVQADRAQIYRVFSALIMHQSYIHLVGNLFGVCLLMYELEFCWKWSILMSLAAGVTANFLTLAVLTGVFLGFSGVICGSVGILIASYLSHFGPLRDKYGKQFYIMLFMNIFFAIGLVAYSQASLVHFFGFFFGFLLGFAFYPRMTSAEISPSTFQIVRIVSLGLVFISILLGILI